MHLRSKDSRKPAGGVVQVWDEYLDPDEDAYEWVHERLAAAVRHAPEARQLLIAAKSMGTLGAADAAEHGWPGIWLTPLLNDGESVVSLRRRTAPALLIGGTADPMWNGRVAREITDDVLELDGADHGLAKIEHFQQIVDAVTGVRRAGLGVDQPAAVRSRRSPWLARAENASTAPTAATTAATSRIAFSPEMNSSRPASLTWPGAPKTFPPTLFWKIAPSAAMPVAMPSWRKVLLIPEAMPARSWRTVETAVVASGAFTKPMPMPPTMKPGSSVVHPESPEMPLISQSERAHNPSPKPSSNRIGTREESRPASGAATNETRLSGRNRTPVWSGDKPRTSCR